MVKVTERRLRERLQRVEALYRGATTPGERWDEESGLSDVQYILPGGGGFGEIMNNSFV